MSLVLPATAPPPRPRTASTPASPFQVQRSISPLRPAALTTEFVLSRLSNPETATIQGGSAGTLNGIFYLPSAGLALSSSNATFNVDLVVSWMNLTGPSTINEYEPLDVPSSVPNPVVVE